MSSLHQIIYTPPTTSRLHQIIPSELESRQNTRHRSTRSHDFTSMHAVTDEPDSTDVHIHDGFYNSDALDGPKILYHSTSHEASENRSVELKLLQKMNSMQCFLVELRYTPIEQECARTVSDLFASTSTKCLKKRNNLNWSTRRKLRVKETSSQLSAC